MDDKYHWLMLPDYRPADIRAISKCYRLKVSADLVKAASTDAVLAEYQNWQTRL